MIDITSYEGSKNPRRPEAVICVGTKVDGCEKKIQAIHPTELDYYIKKELATQLAEALIEEDLIQIKSNYDIVLDQYHFTATLKIVQE